MRIRLNLATKPLQTHRHFLVGSGLLGLFGALVFVILGWHVYSARKASEELRLRTDQLAREINEALKNRRALEAFFEQPENAKLSDRAEFLNSILDAGSFNWTQMFMDLEHVLPGGVRVVRIEPKLVKGNMEVTLLIGASTDEAKLKFLKALETSREFSRVTLISEHAPAQPASGDQTMVELKMIYSRT
jgi:Tfp pilus assembly protein PilN